MSIMTENNKIHSDQYTEAYLRYYALYCDTLRFGQFLCNHFNIKDSNLFYIDNDLKATNIFMERYLIEE